LVDGVARSECSFNMGAVHSERLLPTIEHVMRDANTTGDELDVIAVTVGPGSFTGLRVGVTTAKVLAYGWKKPIVPVNTLEALAWQVAGLTGLVVAALNARRLCDPDSLQMPSHDQRYHSTRRSPRACSRQQILGSHESGPRSFWCHLLLHLRAPRTGRLIR
jgi:hypothetical protein